MDGQIQRDCPVEMPGSAGAYSSSSVETNPGDASLPACMPLELVAQWLGHRNPTTTLVYAYADTKHKRKAIEKAMEHSRVTAELSASNGQPVYKITDENLLKRLYGLD